MKTLLMFIPLFLMLGCTQNDDRQLNDGIYDGRGGISCKVNGQVLKPSAAILYNNKGFAFGTNQDNIQTLQISFTNSKGYDSKLIRIVAVDAPYESDLDGRVFVLKNELSQDSFGIYDFYKNGAENKYVTDAINNGELKILYYNKNTNIMGGTFWFDAINSNGEIVRVTEGKFDLKG